MSVPCSLENMPLDDLETGFHYCQIWRVDKGNNRYCCHIVPTNLYDCTQVYTCPLNSIRVPFIMLDRSALRIWIKNPTGFRNKPVLEFQNRFCSKPFVQKDIRSDPVKRYPSGPLWNPISPYRYPKDIRIRYPYMNILMIYPYDIQIRSIYT